MDGNLVNRSETKRITIVVPAYNEQDNLPLFHDAVNKVIRDLDRYEWQLLFVDDGSRDNTWRVIQSLAKSDSRVGGISLSRNFGKEIALTAGAEAIKKSDAVVFMDADLQHPPALIRELVGKWEEGYQIASTRRTAIKYSLVREAGSRLFYSVLRRYSDLDIQPKATDFRLIDGKVLAVLQTFEERTRFFRGLIDWMGFKKTVVDFEAPCRRNGSSSFNLRGLIKFAVNSITTFSLLPLRFTGYLGLFVTLGSAMVLAYMVGAMWLVGEIFTPLAYFVVFNTFLFGVVLAALGMMALYIGHIYAEVIRRPLYIVQERIGLPDPVAACA